MTCQTAISTHTRHRHRPIRQFLLAGLLGLCAGTAGWACDLPTVRPSATEAVPQNSFDTARFVAEVQAALDDRVMGYSVTLRARSGTVIAQVNHGYARTLCEDGGERRFNGRTVSAIGSVSKVFTAALVIHRAERLPEVSLDDPFRNYLPQRWQAGLHSSMRGVTLRQMIGHRAGFAHSGRTYFGRSYSYEDRLRLGGESYIARARNMALGENDCVPEWVSTPAPGRFARCYANASMALWNFSAASIRPGPWQEIEAGWSPGEIDYESYITVHAGRLYREAVERQILQPAGATAGCNEHGNAARAALIYDDPEDERGTDLSDPGEPCAIGGWFMSTRDLTAAVHRLVNTREVINENHDLMFASDGERLVFFSARSVEGGRAVGHGGSRQGGSARAEVIVFPTGMVAAVIVNSRSVGEGPALDTMLLRAYDVAAE
jgi:CubicO group peptidase (beta-lactamase class C family)